MLSASYDRNDMVYGKKISLKKQNNGGNGTSQMSGTENSYYAKAHLQGGSVQAIVFGDWSENITSWFVELGQQNRRVFKEQSYLFGGFKGKCAYNRWTAIFAWRV